jgi:type IV pilus assembly protein PilA
VKIRRLFSKLQHGEKGFTLIELLVVVAILGILAAVIILNVMGMIGTGTVEAANTEAHNVQIAVLAAMVNQDVYELVDAGTVGPGHVDTVVGTAPSSENVLVINYFSGSLEATYTLGTDGHIVSASPTSGGKFAGLHYHGDADSPPNTGWEENP